MLYPCLVHRSDPELIRACQAGEQAAWNQLVEQYGRLVYSIPKRYGLNDADADDVFAAVWATAFRKLGDLRDDTRLSAWLITTTHRESWRVGKNRGRNVYPELDQNIADVNAPSAAQIEQWERQHIVRQALEAVGGKCKDLLEALFLEAGLDAASYESVSRRLGIPAGSIGPTRARCFAKMEKVLAELGFEGKSEF